MAKRWTRKRKRGARRVLLLILVLVLAVVSYFTEPWQYLGDPASTTAAGGDIGNREEAGITDLQVHYIDVGQGDSILIRVPTAGGIKNMLIDAGTSETSDPANLESYLRSVGVSKLDYLLISHPDADHIGAADEVIRDFDIGQLLFPVLDDTRAGKSGWVRVLTAADKKGYTFTEGKAGMTFSLGDAQFTILGPVHPEEINDSNNFSLVVRLVYGETSFLFTGDAEKESEAAMLAAYPASAFRTDVLKVGHHGSVSSTTQAFLNAVSPSVAVISCGKDNSYGHPHTEILDRLNAKNIEILRTDLLGTVILCSDKTEVYRANAK